MFTCQPLELWVALNSISITMVVVVSRQQCGQRTVATHPLNLRRVIIENSTLACFTYHSTPRPLLPAKIISKLQTEKKDLLMSFSLCVFIHIHWYTIYKAINELNPYHVTALLSNYIFSKISHVKTSGHFGLVKQVFAATVNMKIII